ncbi:MAG: VTT domain-containing protein [Chloroflexota bacterium]
MQVEKGRPKGRKRFYLVSGLSLLLSLLVLVALVYFQDEIRYAGGYGYVGVFFVGVLCGVTIIPAPTLLLVFTLGHVLNPVYVGLVAGLGGAIGGITVYLTGAGMGTIWSRLWRENHILERNSNNNNMKKSIWHKFWDKGQVYYNRLVGWIGGKGGAWTLFITSAMVISPFYFAGLAAGSLRIGLLKFFLLTWAGKTVRYLFVAFAGYWGLSFVLRLIGA